MTTTMIMTTEMFLLHFIRVSLNIEIREDINSKKTFSFGHCPNYLTPPPRPQFGQLGPLFSEVEIQDLKVSLELKILYMSHSQMLGKFESGGGPIFKVVLEC